MKREPRNPPEFPFKRSREKLPLARFTPFAKVNPMTAAPTCCMSSRAIAGHLSGAQLSPAPLRRKAPFPDDIPHFAPGLILGAQHILSPFHARPYLARSGIYSSCSASECPKKPNVSSIFREPDKNIPRKCRLQNRPGVYLQKEEFLHALPARNGVLTFTRPAVIAADLPL